MSYHTYEIIMIIIWLAGYLAITVLGAVILMNIIDYINRDL